MYAVRHRPPCFPPVTRLLTHLAESLRSPPCGPHGKPSLVLTLALGLPGSRQGEGLSSSDVLVSDKVYDKFKRFVTQQVSWD